MDSPLVHGGEDAKGGRVANAAITFSVFVQSSKGLWSPARKEIERKQRERNREKQAEADGGKKGKEKKIS